MTTPDDQRDDEAVRRFVERFALDLVDGGVPRMPARVFAALLASDSGRLTSAELGDRLGVSPGAISSAVRYLAQVRLIDREREPGARRDHYRLYDATWYDSVLRREEMLVRWERDLAEGVRSVGADTPAGMRLDETRRFFVFLDEEVPKLLERWRQVRDDERAAAGG